jgi:hypothetical protein
VARKSKLTAVPWKVLLAFDGLPRLYSCCCSSMVPCTGDLFMFLSILTARGRPLLQVQRRAIGRWPYLHYTVQASVATSWRRRVAANSRKSC